MVVILIWLENRLMKVGYVGVHRDVRGSEIVDAPRKEGIRCEVPFNRLNGISSAISREEYRRMVRLR
jgi:hypothetical protein